MESTIVGVENNSDIYFYHPSQYARRLFYYPLAAGHFLCNSLYCVERDRYDSFLILAVLHGNLVFEQDGIKLTAGKNELFLIDCYKPHKYYAETNAETLWFHFNGAESRLLLEEIVAQNGNKIIFSAELQYLIQRIVDYQGDEYEISADIYRILCLLYSSKKQSSADENKIILIRKAEEYIDCNLHKDILVEDIAKSVHMSASYFSRVFKDATGFSPYEYLLGARLKKAKELLLKGDFPISYIACMTGFNSVSNFNYFFKKQTGISPLKFRKMQF